MKPERKEELITRWIDGELTEADRAEWETAIADDPSIAKEAESAREIGRRLRKEIPASQEPPYPDFFNSQIQKRIREESVAPATTGTGKAQSAFSLGGFLSWLRSPLTLASAAAVILAFVANNALRPDTEELNATDHTIVQAVYAPDTGIKITSGYDEEASAHVILLDGLAAIPGDVEVSGKTVAMWEPAPKFGNARFFDVHGRLVYILHATPTGLPNIIPISEEI